MSEFEATIILTGGTLGIGLEAAYIIAAAQPKTRLVIASRKDPASVAATINRSLGHDNVVFHALDLTSNTSVRSFCDTITSLYKEPISALVLNAGVALQTTTASYSADGVETTFAANHVGHALLLFLLAPHLTSDARIVVTSSAVHFQLEEQRVPWGTPAPQYTSAELLAHPDEKAKHQPGVLRYTTSKLANILWTNAVARRLPAHGRQWTINSFDPGLVPLTGLTRTEATGGLWWLYDYLTESFRVGYEQWKSSNPNIRTRAYSGANLARLAIDDEVAGVTGKYFEGAKEVSSSKISYEEAKQEDIWEWTLGFITNNQAERDKFESFR